MVIFFFAEIGASSPGGICTLTDDAAAHFSSISQKLN